MIAPKLQSSLREIVKGVPLFSTIHGEEATKELRALLAVARAAGPVSEWIQAQKWRLPSDADLRLSKSLARLRRASAAAGKGTKP